MSGSSLDRLRRSLLERASSQIDDAAIELAYPGSRRGAVLALFYPLSGQPHLALTRRTPHLSLHSGQISLPGGRIDPHDLSPAAAALRETEEELGIVTNGLELYGPLEPVYIVVSNYVLLAYVGFSAGRPSFRPNPQEVAEVIELPLGHLLDPAQVTEEWWELRGARRRVGFYRFGEHKIWGATARVLRQISRLAGGEEPPGHLVPPGEVEPEGPELASR